MDTDAVVILISHLPNYEKWYYEDTTEKKVIPFIIFRVEEPPRKKLG